MTTRTPWLMSLCWIAATLLVFFAIGGSSSRAWLYLTTVALVPPIVLNGLWREHSDVTIGEVMRGGRM
jgi:hypothetical protein